MKPLIPRQIIIANNEVNTAPDNIAFTSSMKQLIIKKKKFRSYVYERQHLVIGSYLPNPLRNRF